MAEGEFEVGSVMETFLMVQARAIYDSVYPPGGKRLAASLRPSAREQSTPTAVRLQPIVNRSKQNTATAKGLKKGCDDA